MTDAPTDFDDDVRYDDRTGTYRLAFDRSADGSPSVSIVLAIATIEGVDPADLPPLDYTVDTDALDALFGSRDGRGARMDGSLTFEYEGYRVTTASEEIVFDPSPDE